MREGCFHSAVSVASAMITDYPPSGTEIQWTPN